MFWTLALPPLRVIFRRHWRSRAPGSARGEVLPSALIVVGLVACASIWLIRGRAEALTRSSTFAHGELQSYLSLRADLDLLLVFLSCSG